MKGKGKATYYVPGDRFPVAKHETTPPQGQTTPPQVQTTAPQDQITAPQGQITAPQGQTTAPRSQTTAPLPEDLASDLAALGRKAHRERVVGGHIFAGAITARKRHFILLNLKGTEQ